jgi:serine/threonine protein kinase
MVREICDVLTAADEQGIIYRDLKPSNIKIKDVQSIDESSTASPQIIAVQNWMEELKRLVPTK